MEEAAQALPAGFIFSEGDYSLENKPAVMLSY